MAAFLMNRLFCLRCAAKRRFLLRGGSLYCSCCGSPR